MNQPEFWNDPDHSAKVNQKVSNLKGKLEHYEKLLSSADDIEVMLEMAEEEKEKTPSLKRWMSWRRSRAYRRTGAGNPHARRL